MNASLGIPLGQAAFKASRLGLGGHTFLRRFGGRDRPDEAALLGILNAALDHGITLLDATYDEERELLGQTLRASGRRNEAVVSCWAEAKRTPDGPATVRECERALAQLGLECLEHFYIEVDVSDAHAEALARLKRDGKLRAAGVLGPSRAVQAGKERIDAAVGVFNYYRREAAQDFQTLRAAGIGCLGVEPLGRGRFLQENPHEAPRIAAALLRFALQQPFLDSVLVTMRSRAEVAANAAAASAGPLTPDEDALLQRGQGYNIPFDPWK